MIRRRTASLPIFASFGVAALSACQAPEPPDAPGKGPASSAPVRLFDRTGDDTLRGRLEGEAEAIPRTEWRFDNAEATAGTKLGWTAGPGVSELAVEDGRLVGVTTDRVALAYVEVPESDDDDYLHEILVRARILQGSQLSVRVQPDFEGGIEAVAERTLRSSWGFDTPLLPGEEMHTYRLSPTFWAPRRPGVRHVILWPSNEPGARFEIESVRLVFRKEHLAGLESGGGWHGLAEIYQEALLARAGESFAYELRLPARPRLELELGTIESGAVTFTIDIEGANGSRRLERTITTPDRWQRAALDLADLAGEPVALSLGVVSPHAGALGLIGNPVVRSLGPPGGGRPRGVVFLLGDTLRRDHLDAYGYERETAPVLSRLAREGALFRDLIAQGPWTKVSAPSIMTSLYQRSHGVTDFSTRLPAAAATLAEIFRDAGYATIAYSSVPFTGRFNNMHQGYEVLHESTSTGRGEGLRNAKTAREYVDRFVDWLDDHRDVPFFAFVHVFDPHDPFEPRDPYDTMWADPAAREEHLRQQDAAREFIEHPRRKEWGMPTVAELEAAGLDPEAYIRVDLDWYDGSIRGMDAEIGRLLEQLRGLGLEREVVVAFTSDHGEEFHDHGDITHGHSLYTELLDVPFLLWAPGRVPGGVPVDATVESIDILPTLLDVAGFEIPETIQGRSLAPLLRTQTADAWQERAAFAELHPPGTPDESPLEAVAVVSQRWKLVHNTQRADARPEFELYDRSADPREQTNLAEAHPEVVKTLLAELENWRSRTDALRLSQDTGEEELSAEQLDRLRALGYVQ